MNQVEFTQFIKQEALALGFLSCGISRAEFLEEEAKPLESWLNKGFNGQMQWMENNFDKRLDPRILVEGCLSVISFSLNYFPLEVQNSSSFKISKYAYGNDYHEVIKEKLQVLFSKMKEKFPALEGRAFVDSAPIMDKAWAKRAGLGWVGKNTNLINPQQGSFFFLAEMLVNLELEYDQTFANDHCGTCTKCIDVCPTEAIIAPYQIDGSKCISYYTIELKEQLPNDMQGKFDDWIFGCDVCQDVCPWNKFSLGHQEEKLKMNKQIMHYSKSDWQDLKEEEFKILFKHSPIKRTKYEGFMRNIRFVS